MLGYEGDNAFYRGDYKSAADLYNQALDKASHTTDAHLILVSKVNGAKTQVALGAYKPAAASLRTLSQEADSMGLKYVSAECAIYQAQASIGTKKYGEAKANLQIAMNSGEKLGLHVLPARERDLYEQAQKKLGFDSSELQFRLIEFGKPLGPPWGQDQKLAMLAAWLALANTVGSRR